MLLELRVRRLRDVLGGAVELLTEPADQRTVLVDRALQPLGLVADLRLCVGGYLSNALWDARELGGEALLQLAQIGDPDRQPLGDAAFGFGESLQETRRCIALALGYVASTLVGDPPFLLDEDRERLRARELQRLRELRAPLRGLACDGPVEHRLAALQLLVERPRTRMCPAQQVDGGSCREHRHERGDERDDCGGVHGSRLGARVRRRSRGARWPR